MKKRGDILPKSETSLKELLYDIRRIEKHREKLTEEKINSIYRSLEKDLNSFIAEEYVKYADEEGRLFTAYLDSKNRSAKFLQEIINNVDNIDPALREEIQTIVNTTYKKAYKGMSEALLKADKEGKLAEISKDIEVNPYVLKQAVNNNISKLTLPAVLDKHRAEIIYQIQQELNIGLMQGDRYETMAKRVSQVLRGNGVTKGLKGKSMNIVRTETHRNIESGFMDCAERIQGKLEGSDLIYAATWRNMGDERVRPQVRRKTKKGWKTSLSKNGANHIKMEGQTVKVGELFNLGNGVKAKAPSQSGVAAHDCNCRCFLEYNLMTPEEFAKATGRKIEFVQPKQPEQPIETERVELKLSDYPETFTKGAEGKNTQKLIDYVNNIEGANPNAVKLYSSMGRMENFTDNGIPFKISHGKNHAVTYSYKASNHHLADVKLNIPKLSGDNLAGQVNVSLHEQMHLLDMCGRTDPKKYNNWFSSQQKPLIDTFRKTSADMSDEIADLFKKHNAEHDAVRERLEKTYKKKILDTREKYLPNGKPSWEDYASYEKYEKEVRKLRKAMEVERDYESRNIMGGGVGNLQDIYDALSKGKYRTNGTVYYGHGQRYYATEVNRIEETVANYTALSVTRPDLVDMLRRDKPELCAELDNLIVELLKKAGG